LAASKLFTIYVYTAGNKTYADAVINTLPNGTFITKRFYRESCIQYRGDIIKDLNIIKKSIDENEK
jgi:TFIIF-interacting CTD phosphatase-like protein